jgi:hypothetical protein
MSAHVTDYPRRPDRAGDRTPEPTRREHMIQFDLNDDERRILKEVLESSLSDLRMEIADTERLEFRDGLKVRKDVIAKAIAALGD